MTFSAAVGLVKYNVLLVVEGGAARLSPLWLFGIPEPMGRTPYSTASSTMSAFME